MVRTLTLSVLFSFLLFSVALAAPITVSFTGDIYTVGADISGVGVSVGDTVTGQFTYDTITTDSNSLPYYGVYVAQGFDIALGSSFTASSSLNSATIVVQNDQQNGAATLPADGLKVLANNVTADTLANRNVIKFQYGLLKKNEAGHLWFDDFLPDVTDWANVSLVDINNPGWNWMQFEQRDTDTNIFSSQIRWNITSFSATSASVPEPATFLLLGSGLAGLAFYRKKRG